MGELGDRGLGRRALGRADQTAPLPGRRLADFKHSKESEAAGTVIALTGHEPFAFTTLVLRLAAWLQRNIVTVTTNVPGPPTQLAMLGRPVLEAFPYVPIALRLRTGVAALSYRDQMTFGVTADFDSSPDVALFAEAIERGVADLTAAAELPVEATS